MLRLAFLLMLLPLAGQAACREVTFESVEYAVCEVNSGQDLRLFLQGADGIYGNFAAVDAALAPDGERLGFAINAGMFHPDLAPVGLYIEDGVQRAPLVASAGPGNFGLLPNGVFCIADRFSVIETRAFAANPPPCRYATQSGPMLVIGGALHPRFLPESDSLYIRNGVGVSDDGSRAFVAISKTRVNFYDFARFFRDGLAVNNALYLDGAISRLYAPELGRDDFGFRIGPILGLVLPRD